MHVTRLATSLPTLALASTAPHNALATDYGHWELTLYETWAPSGVYHFTSIWSEYWSPAGTPGPIVYCADEWSPDSRGHVHTPCNDTSFSCTLLGQYYPPETCLYEIRQTVELGGEKVQLVGRKNMTKIRSGAGTTLRAEGRVEAVRVGVDGTASK